MSLEVLEAEVSAKVASGDHSGALIAIRHAWPRIVSTDGDGLRHLVESLPFDDWNNDPWILAALGASYRSLGSQSRSAALPYFQTAQTLLDAVRNPSVSITAGVRSHHAAALRSLGQLRAAEEQAGSAWQLLSDDLTLTPAQRVAAQTKVALESGIIALHLGDYDSARARLRLALGLSDHYLNQTELIECLGALEFLAYAEGDFTGALEFSERVHATATPAILASPFGSPALIAELLIAVERNQLPAALELAAQVATASRRSDWEPLGLYATAAISIISGRHIEGLDHVHRARRATASWDGPAVIDRLCEGMRGSLLMHLGELDAAVEILANLEPTQHHANCPARFVAGIRFGKGDYSGCLRALDACEALGESHASRTFIDVLLLKAAANYELGNPVVADVAFDRALLSASRSGVRTSFTLIPNITMQRMANRAVDRIQPPAVHAVLEEMRGGHRGTARPALEPLSQRERDIAQHLCLDKTVNQIAAELFISSNTVKTHVRSIYRKLDATNRKDATRRVRELGLDLEITQR